MLLFRDLNEVLWNLEKHGRRSVWNKTLYLRDFMQIFGSLDVGFVSKCFT